MSADRVGAAVESEARRIERETACAALAHRMATSAWRGIYFALGVPTTALAAIAGATALAHYPGRGGGPRPFGRRLLGPDDVRQPGRPGGRAPEACSRYQAVANRARLLWEISCAGETGTERLRQELDELLEEWSKTNEGSPPLFESFNRRAQRRAEEGV